MATGLQKLFFTLLAGAAITAGNSRAIVAFNPGIKVPVVCHTRHEDYTAGEVALRITKDDVYRPEWPMLLKERSFVSICSKRDYAEARDTAIAEATQILARVAGVTQAEAHLYVTTVGDLRNGAIWALGQTEPDWARQMVQVVGLDCLNDYYDVNLKRDRPG